MMRDDIHTPLMPRCLCYGAQLRLYARYMPPCCQMPALFMMMPLAFLHAAADTLFYVSVAAAIHMLIATAIYAIRRRCHMLRDAYFSAVD